MFATARGVTIRYKVDGVPVTVKPGRGLPATDGGLWLSALYATATELVGTQERRRGLVRLLMAERDGCRIGC